MRIAATVLATAMLGGGVTVSTQQKAHEAPPAEYGYRVVRSYPHDRDAFTQGLEYVDGVLYEGTGRNGHSGIRKVKLETGEVLQAQPLDARYFGEGITVWKNRIIQLTWQSEVGFVYDRQTFKPHRTFQYTGEGWGLTHDGTRLIMSDGSSTGTLKFFDPETLRQTGTLTVRDGGRPVANLNELEFVKGQIYANVWQTDRIAIIAPKTGRVTGWVDLHGLLDPREAGGVDVLNGIAYDAAGDRLFVTGKLWPRIFEIRLTAKRS
jgi:glutamine cyclotransferase